MENLKVGDIIKLVSHYGDCLTIGKKYEIIYLSEYIFSILDDEGDERNVEYIRFNDYFIKVDNQSERNQEQRPSGGSTHYYELPKNATELKHLIRHKKMSHPIGEAFCSLYRLNDNGEYKRNLEKAKYYIETELQYLEEGRD